MNKLSIRGKLAVLFCIAIITSLITIGLSAYSSYELTELEAQKAQEIMLDAQKEKLKSAVSSMAAALSGAVASLDEEQEQLKLMRSMIKDAFYEEDLSGYYFIYKGTVNVAHPVKPSLHGKDLDNLVGKDGIYSVRELARAARNGGDFVHFTWDKPGYDKPMPQTRLRRNDSGHRLLDRNRSIHRQHQNVRRQSSGLKWKNRTSLPS